MTSPAVVVDDLTVSLGGTTVLDGVSTTIDRGTFVGLIGPNGAGKTTLLRSINGVLTPESGVVEVDGDRIGDLSSKAASRRVATVPQDTAIAFDFDVREAVEMGRTPHLSRFGGWTDEDHEAVDRAMARTEVTAFEDRPITSVSGGERQRVLLARALAQETPVLLLDEPTASLDINHQVETLELVGALVDDGHTVVAAIHDLDLAARYCDDLLLLGDGEVLAEGPPRAVLQSTHLDSAFDASTVVARHPATGTPSVTAVTDRGTATGRVHVVGGGGRASRYLRQLADTGYDVSFGPVTADDPDTETAREHGVDCLTVAPFSRPDDDLRDHVTTVVSEVDAVVVADAPVSQGTRPAIRAAHDRDAVVVEERPLARRNYAGERGRRAYERLCDRGTVVTPAAVCEAVATAVAAGESPSSPQKARMDGGRPGDDDTDEDD